MRTGDPLFDRWDGRLQNWALWVCGTSSNGISSAYDGDREWDRPPRMPIALVGEALDTDDLVHRLNPEHYIAVRAVYVWTGTMEQRAAEVGITSQALNQRVDAAMYELERMYHARHIRSGIRAGLNKVHACN